MDDIDASFIIEDLVDDVMGSFNHLGTEHTQCVNSGKVEFSLSLDRADQLDKITFLQSAVPL